MEIRSISAAAAFRVAVTVLGVVVALRFLWVAHAIFIVAFLGILLGLALQRAVDLLEKVRIRRAVGAPLALLFFLGLLAGFVALAAPSIRDQAQQITRALPQAVRSIEARILRSPARVLVTGAAAPGAGGQEETQGKTGSPQQQPERPSGGPSQEAGGPGLAAPLRGFARVLFPVVSSTLGAFGGIVMVLFVALYVAAEPRLYRTGMLHLVPKRNRERAEDLADALADTLRQWLIARLLAMVVVGAVTGGALALLGVKGAIALGVLSGLLEFVPFFGPIASAIPAIGIAFIDSPQKALSVALLYLVIQQLEGSLLTPLLLRRRLDIPPVLTLVVVAALGVVFGVIGMLIAEPLLAAALVTTRMLYVEDVVGDEVGSSA